MQPAKPLFPWMGGKYKLAKRICQLFPGHTCYVELFAGAANLLLAKQPAKAEVLNDINSDLTNLFRIVRFHPRALITELATTTHSRQEFQDATNYPGQTDIQRAARTLLIYKASFGGQGGAKSQPTFGYGTTGRAHFRRSIHAAIRRIHRRLDGVCIENLDYADCIQRYDRKHTLFYCDPPYLETAGYQTDFTIEDHQLLASTLAKIKGKFLLSINDHKEIRKLYQGFPRLKVTTKYSITRDKKAAVTDRPELAIANFPLPRRL